MSYSIFLSDDRKYIVLEITGEITAKAIMQMIIESHAFGAKNQISKYLVDATRARNTSTISENYQFAYGNMKETPEINQNAIVAMLVDPEDHTHDFIETVSRNAGYNAKMFRNREEAITFLTAE